MARYIDANELQKRLTKIADEPDYLHENETWNTGICLAGTQVDLMPTADVVEVKHGEWYLLDECANEGVYCSICHKKVYKTEYANQKLKSNYCPNCGAKMDGGKDE